MSKGSDIRFVGLSSISLNKYIRPEVKEYRVKRWVLNGTNNSFYKDLIEAYYGSTTHGSVVDSYINLIYGRGLTEENGDTESQEWTEFLNKFSKKDQKKVITDYEIFGEFAVQVIRQKGNRNKLAKLIHIEKDRIAPSIEDEFGNINSYWYSRDWAQQYKVDANGKQSYMPVEYPAFGLGEAGETEIFVAKPYKVGKEYFSDPDYLQILPYAYFEQELANYYLKYIKNGLSLGNIINIPNSHNWSDEEKDNYIKKSNSKLTGSENANTQVYSFNSSDQPTTIESIKNEYAHKQWDFLTVEARQQILTGHKATSPSLVGVISSSGFSNTADEMDEAEHQLMKRVISPKQNFIIDSIREVLDYFGEDRKLEFLPLTEKVNTEETTIEVEENVDVALKKKVELDLFLAKGETEDLSNYRIVDEIEVDYSENLEFASTGTARPNAKSEQDSDDIIIRYRYVGNKTPQREFCQKMMSAEKVYRKEDIIQLDNKAVNAGWGANGADTYSIWLYKGGGSCHHKWNRVIYLRKGKDVDPNSPLAEIISTSEARRRGYKVPTNDTLVSIEPRNMTNNGFLKPRK